MAMFKEIRQYKSIRRIYKKIIIYLGYYSNRRLYAMRSVARIKYKIKIN